MPLPPAACCTAPISSRVRSTVLSGLLATLGLPLALPAAAAGPAAAAAPASAAASAPADGVRLELLDAFNGAQELLRAQKYAEARVRLKEVEAAPGLSRFETYQLDRLLLSVAVGLNDGATAERHYASVATSGRLSEAELAPLLFNVMVAAYRGDDFARAVSAAAKVRAYPAMSAPMREQAQQIQVQSLYLGKDYPAAAREIEAEVAATRAAGQVPTEQRLRMLASCYSQTRAMPSYFKVIEQLVVAYPKRDYWIDLIARVQNLEKFSDRLWLELQRFKHTVVGLKDANDYFESAEAALQANLPIEARSLLDAGYAAGLLGKGAQAAAHDKLRRDVATRVPEDDAVVNNPAAVARISREPVALVHWGQSLIAAGKADAGLPLLEEALTKPALKRTEEVRLRLGAAYAAAGRKEQAAATLKAVKGDDGSADIAQLWLLQQQLAASAR
jgi:hypothetical protein